MENITKLMQGYCYKDSKEQCFNASFFKNICRKNSHNWLI